MDISVLLINIFSSITVELASGKKLLQANVIWRHGDRSSGHTYPNDPYKDYWKSGPYQLTERGMAQAYNLGIFLKEKYGHLLSEVYQKDEIHIKSTDLDRTKMTAQCVIAGLYSPKGHTKWNSKRTPWIPFPIHTTDASEDWLLQVQQDPEEDCPKFDILVADVQRRSQKFKEISSLYSEFFKKVQKFTGSPVPYNLYTILNVFDNLNCLKENDHLLPEWADKDMMTTLEYLAGIAIGVRFTDIESDHTMMLSKMRNGIILQKMIENMKKRIKEETSLSFVGYSAHDSTLTPLLISLGAFNWLLTPYASCVMIDLFEVGKDQYSIEIWYRNDSTKEPYPLTFYECGKQCSFDKFLSVASTVMTDETTPLLCGISRQPNTDYRYFVYFLCASLILYLFISRRRHHF